MPGKQSIKQFKTCVPIRWDRVRIGEGFWGKRVAVNRKVTLPIEYEQCLRTGRIDAFKLDWKPGMDNQPHHFWDSDVAKWVEAATYSLATHPDKNLQAKLDHVVDLIASAQQDDGYLNVYFTVVKPEERWTNLRDMHELYCAGHLMEAAVALYEATGQRKLLDVMCRYADYIDSLFGEGQGKRRGYPGHEEIELALVKLYRATGNQKYLDLAAFFVHERGADPHYFELEARKRNAPKHHYGLEYYQSHAPVCQQKTVEGHAVRAMYLLSGVADVACLKGDKTLHKALKRLWDNTVNKRMYITGGVGSSPAGERFTFDYDLPNETAYAETCAAIALVFFAHRMAQIELAGEYGDVIEKALFNGVLSGVNLKGDRFFYANPLRSSPSLMQAYQPGHVSGQRQAWFGCACCPPNIARLFASLGQYIYAHDDSTLIVHQYIASQTSLSLGGSDVTLRMQTQYPWDETVNLQVDPQAPATFTLALRIPGWCSGAIVTINGKRQNTASNLMNGYLYLARKWAKGDVVQLTLPMPIERMHTHPACRVNQGKVALQRGPLVYCVEEVDCGFDPSALLLPADASLKAVHEPRLLGGVTVIQGQALRFAHETWQDGLYASTTPKTLKTRFRAIPYCLWANRKVGSMSVWLNAGDARHK